MFSENNRISGRQVFRLLTYDLLGLSTLLIPAVLARVAGRDGIFCIAIGIAAGLLYLRLLRRILSDMKVEFYVYLEQKLGKFSGRLIQLGYLIYFVLLAGYTAYIFADAVLESLLREESFFLVLFMILLLAAYGLWGGIEGRARVYEMLFWFIMIPLFLMLFFALDEIQADYWTPVFFSDAWGILKGSYYVFVCMALVFLVLFLGQYVENGRALFQAGKMALLFNGGVHAVLYLLLLGIFGAGALGGMDYPAITMMSTVKISGGFLKRTDAFMFAVWFFTLYALLNSCVFYGGSVLTHLLGRLGGNAKRQTRERNASLAILVIVFGIAWGFYKSRELFSWYEWFLWHIGTPFLIFVPLLLAGGLFFSGRKEGGRGMRTLGMTALVLLSGSLLSGCGTAELEDRNFPIEMAVEDTDNVGAEWLNAENGGNRLVDYSHLKVLVLSRDFIEDEKAMSEFLSLMEQKNEVPRNTYLVVAEDAGAILDLEDTLGESVGNYLEQQFENVSQIKKQAYPTLGMLYQEVDNRSETLLIPFVKEEDGKPVVQQYYVWKRGRAAGSVESKKALLSFFTANNMDSYTLPLCGGEIVTLFAPHNEIRFEENGDRRIVVEIHCSGEMISGELQTKETYFEQLIAEYMNVQAKETLLKQQIDLSNSYRKLGNERRDWYQEYLKEDTRYESEMEIVYEVEIDWVNL